ncbi:MAG TPA: HEAT repeat domain-containing protein, partial [Pyrinomonadaceae bacterium]|nr:HEAT repeat domain-containing protein [Pyrinomonadaceae bacterium]
MPSNPSSLDPSNGVDSERNGFAEVRRDLLTSDSASVRAAAARQLGSLRNQAGIAILIVALQDNSPEVRSAAVEALRLIGDATALGPL